MATIQQLLQTTSRTFALAIPFLPPVERIDVMLGYLVFRIADTLEDADRLSRDERIRGLEEFAAVLGDPQPTAWAEFANRWAARRPSANGNYQQLLRQTPDVLAALAGRQSSVRETIARHARRSIAGMCETLSRADADGSLMCQSVEELRNYCYSVAGIVGELLSELFIERLELSDPPQALATLRRDARWFGEGLQLVNILKDVDADAQAGRTYLPREVTPSEMFALAREDLTHAARYIASLRQLSAPPGYIAFTRAPRELALATLAAIEAKGPGAKLTRLEVSAILEDIQREFAETMIEKV